VDESLVQKAVRAAVSRAGLTKRANMAKLQDEIAESFLEKLKETPDVTPEMVDGLRDLLSAKKTLKGDDLVKVFSPPADGDVK
jgi:predicted nuclease with TOPRIM domain